MRHEFSEVAKVRYKYSDLLYIFSFIRSQILGILGKRTPLWVKGDLQYLGPKIHITLFIHS